jgi:nitroimidazol reductase NimA-like FMN-containing flavoprotein (pyridoxamine 5'-phosphate oxidase superfamily)
MPSRRSKIEMSDEEIAAFLDTRKTLIIVSNGVGGFPHPMPMWFHRDDRGVIRCTTFSKSQKVMNYERDPRASLLVESGTEYAELRGVVVYARCEIVRAVDAVVDTLVDINSRGRSLDAAGREALAGAVSKTAAKRVVLAFHPQSYVSWDHTKLGGVY